MLRVLRHLFLFVVVSLLFACEPGDKAKERADRVPGVSATEIRLGSSLAITGHAGYLGTQTLRGAMACIRSVNESGGVHGRRLTVLAEDDFYDPPQCLANTQRFIIENDVFALFCYVGTPTTVKILPLLEEAKIPLVGVFTGANALREPFNPYIINIRASYYQETQAAVRHLVKDLGLRRIAVFYQFDAYGFDGLVGTELALKEFRMEPVGRGSYVRGTRNVTDGLERIIRSRAEAVVMVGTYGACAQFIRSAEDRGFNPIFYNVSFVGAEELARRLGPEYHARVIMSQVVPPPPEDGRGGPGDAAAEYVRLLGKYYPEDPPSFVGLEGFLNARILVEGLRKAGPDLTRPGFIRAIRSIRKYSLGRDMVITFGPEDHQGSDAVHFTVLEHGRFVPFEDWSVLEQGGR
ncbi:ABC transporter substrate-binding protein [Pseudodesulfovibrio tunisiensis]|uniref:ABC transporter substrate-binding protein n=1 Tax=Pseudodesulfovibrio tunisiensis TaxID=463192 RepID=UPI001FB3A04F|nr:ABC transporter substrate-binding protein [Pseudodesulfovibrio tunisiensis]